MNTFLSTGTTPATISTKSKGRTGGRFTPSSGMDKVRKNRRAIRKLKMKIARWIRNQANPKKVAAGKSRNGWNTSGLQKQLAALGGK